MGCASSQSGNIPGNTGPEHSADVTSSTEHSTDSEPSAKYPPAEAFEISLDAVDNKNENDGKSDSLIRKHPPKRLQKLVEQAAATAVPSTTIEHLEEKLAKAEIRRQQYIQQKIDNIVTLTGKGATSIGSRSSKDGSDGDENDENNENRVGGDNIESNGQNDEHNDGGNASVDGETVVVASIQDVDVQPTSSTATTGMGTNEHNRNVADHADDNRTGS